MSGLVLMSAVRRAGVDAVFRRQRPAHPEVPKIVPVQYLERLPGLGLLVLQPLLDLAEVVLPVRAGRLHPTLPMIESVSDSSPHPLRYPLRRVQMEPSWPDSVTPTGNGSRQRSSRVTSCRAIKGRVREEIARPGGRVLPKGGHSYSTTPPILRVGTWISVGEKKSNMVLAFCSAVLSGPRNPGLLLR